MSIQPPPIPLVREFLPIFQWLVPRLNFLVDEGGIPTSWWRSPGFNAAAGGNPESQHLFGFAADFVPGRVAWVFLRDQAERIGLIGVLETDHLHVQVFPAGTLREAGFFETIST